MQDGSGFGFYAQLYVIFGIPVGSEFLVNSYTTSSQSYPSVSMAADGSFVISWYSYEQDGSEGGVYAQRYDSSGSPVGPEFQANTYTTGYQWIPWVAMSDAGDFVIVWKSSDQDGSGDGVYAQRYDSSGNPVGPEFRANSYTPGHQNYQSVAMDADGDFVIAWASRDQDGSGSGVYAQRYDSSGIPIGQYSGLASAPTPGDGSVEVDTETLSWTAGSAAVLHRVYLSTDSTIDGSDLLTETAEASAAVSLSAGTTYYWRVDEVTAGGRVFTGVVWRFTTVVEQAHFPSPADGSSLAQLDPGLSWSAGWGALEHDVYFGLDPLLDASTYQGRQAGTSYDPGPLEPATTYYWKVDEVTSTGTIPGPVWSFSIDLPEFLVNTYTAGNQWLPSPAMDADGNFVVAWTSRYQDGSGNGVYAQRYDYNGNLIGPEFQVNAYTTGDQWDPSVGMAADGNFVIAWQGADTTGSHNVYAQRYDSSGIPVGYQFRVNTYTSGNQLRASAAMADNGSFVIAWEGSEGQDGSGYGVYAQLYGNDGNPVGSEFLANSYTTGSQASPSVGMAADGAFVIVWNSYDQDGSGGGIYAQRYDSSGIPVGAEFQDNTYTTG